MELILSEPSSFAVRGERNVRSPDEERFFWENEDVCKPVNFYPGAAYQIPVIEGEKVEIQCKVRAVSEDKYTIIWDFENFHANTTGKTVLVNNTDGDEYAQDTITVNIERPLENDDKDIICSWENGKFSDTITLQFKVFVLDNTDNSQHCDKCQHGVQLKLKRPGIQKKEDINLEEKIKQKVMREYNVADVFIDSNNYICGCKHPLTTYHGENLILDNKKVSRSPPSSSIIIVLIFIIIVAVDAVYCGEDIKSYLFQKQRSVIDLLTRKHKDNQDVPDVQLNVELNELVTGENLQADERLRTTRAG